MHTQPKDLREVGSDKLHCKKIKLFFLWYISKVSVKDREQLVKVVIIVRSQSKTRHISHHPNQSTQHHAILQSATFSVHEVHLIFLRLIFFHKTKTIIQADSLF